MADGGVSVAKAIPSEAGKHVEVIEDRKDGPFESTWAGPVRCMDT